MRQVFRIGILVSALLIAVAGCASMEKFGDKVGDKFRDTFRDMPAKQETESDQRREGGPVSDTSDQADNRATAPPADGKVRTQVQTLHVQFGSGKWDLDNSAQTFLLVLIKKLRENPKLSAYLEGYTDSVGSRDLNLQLSQKRVEVVRRYLLDRGVDPARIRSVGLGQLPDRGTPEEQAKNRRVTVKLMAASD